MSVVGESKSISYHTDFSQSRINSVFTSLKKSRSVYHNKQIFSHTVGWVQLNCLRLVPLSISKCPARRHVYRLYGIEFQHQDIDEPLYNIASQSESGTNFLVIINVFVYRWNQLDLLIILLSVVGIVLEEMNSELPINPTIIRVMRVLRIARGG